MYHREFFLNKFNSNDSLSIKINIHMKVDEKLEILYAEFVWVHTIIFASTRRWKENEKDELHLLFQFVIYFVFAYY